MERGIKEEDLIKLLNRVKRKKRERKPYFSKAILGGIRERLKGLGVEEAKLQEVIESLTSFFERRLTERVGEFRLETERLAEELMRRNLFLEGIEKGVIIWDSEGKVDFINQSAKESLGLERGAQIRWGLIAAIKSRGFPITSMKEEYSEEKGWSEEDRRILFSISKPIKDENGEVIGALLINGREDAETKEDTG
jgi:sensor histidine kinase regulating citrate/malate metabolism